MANHKSSLIGHAGEAVTGVNLQLLRLACGYAEPIYIPPFRMTMYIGSSAEVVALGTRALDRVASAQYPTTALTDELPIHAKG
jgi:hypothetical protein